MGMLRGITTVVAMVACNAVAQSYTWTDVTPPDYRVEGVGIHPLDGSIIVRGLSATGTAPYVMYSNDHGRSWNPPLTPLPHARSLFVHPGLPGVVFATVLGPNAEELYRSADFGRTWSLRFTGGKGDTIDIFGADPLDVHAAYALLKPNLACHGAFGCLYDRPWDVIRTHDDGASWTTLSTLLGDRFATYAFPSGPTPANPDRLFLTALDHFVLVSRDRGASWSPAESPPGFSLKAIIPDPLRGNVLYGYAYYFLTTDYISHNVSLRSDDGGSTWRVLLDSRFAAMPVIVNPARGRTLWIGPEPDGPYTFAFQKSDDAGETWRAVPYPGTYLFTSPNPLENYAFQGLVLSVAEPDTVYLVQNYHLFRGVPSSSPDPIVVEFQYEGNRYWLTSLEGEAVSQDYRQQPGDVKRTGMKWGVWRADDAPAGAVGSCRFWSKPQSGLRTRVLVQQGFECESLRRDPNWILEAENEFYTLPVVNGACAAGSVAVRRFHNLKADVNHRWVADDATAAEMRSRGWYDEGVRFCGRPMGSNE
jgi:hypothetical protein